MELSFFLVYTLIAISACKPDLDLPDKKRITDYPSLIKEFKDPGKDYQPAPLWVCNNDVSKEDIDFSLNELKDKGMGGVFIHPRTGLITKYLSDQWFDLVAYSMEKAKQIGLNVWIYDEYVCPSGFVGGHVFNEMPESNNQGTALTSQKMEKHSILVNDIYEKSIPIHKVYGIGDDDVHYTENSYEQISELIIDFLQKEINKLKY